MNERVNEEKEKDCGLNRFPKLLVWIRIRKLFQNVQFRYFSADKKKFSEFSGKNKH